MIVILNEMAIYLLLGFLLAGMLHALLQARRRSCAPLEGTGSQAGLSGRAHRDASVSLLVHRAPDRRSI